VVIGGGTSGQEVAKQLIKASKQVIIVQANAFTEQPILQPYHLTRPELYAAKANTKKGSVANLDTVGIEGVQYIVGTVAGLGADGKSIQFDDGRTLEFGALVIAVGIHYPAIMANPGEDFATRLAFVEAFPGKVRAANQILVGGTGPVALEVAAELRRLNATCKIQMVTSGDRALQSWTGTPASVLAQRLVDTNIEVKTGARVDLPPGAAPHAVFDKADYSLSTGEVLKDVDMFLPYFGSSRTEFLPDNATGPSGKVLVNMHGQSTIQSNIFAVGCGNHYPIAVMPVIQKEATVVAANVGALLDGQRVLPASLPAKPPEEHITYVHLGIGQWSALNLEQKGCIPGLLARLCGCFNPLCPCCACCDWCCTYPAGECSGGCFERIIIAMGNSHAVHPASLPAMHDTDMSR
jgi:NADH dehydrogenase FAD-containing subunit